MKKKLDLNFKYKKTTGEDLIINIEGTKSSIVANYFAFIIMQEKSKNSLKIQEISQEIYKNKFIILPVSDFEFLKEHLKSLELSVAFEAPILEAFMNAEKIKDDKKK